MEENDGLKSESFPKGFFQRFMLVIDQDQRQEIEGDAGDFIAG